MRAVLIVVFDFCRCGLIQIKCIQSMPFALNVLIASYSTFTPILYRRLGLRTAMLRGELKMDRHSKSLSTPDLCSIGRDVKPYSLTHSVFLLVFSSKVRKHKKTQTHVHINTAKKQTDRQNIYTVREKTIVEYIMTAQSRR